MSCPEVHLSQTGPPFCVAIMVVFRSPPPISTSSSAHTTCLPFRPLQAPRGIGSTRSCSSVTSSAPGTRRDAPLREVLERRGRATWGHGDGWGRMWADASKVFQGEREVGREKSIQNHQVRSSRVIVMWHKICDHRMHVDVAWSVVFYLQWFSGSR